MKMIRHSLALLALALMIGPGPARAENWPGWRGPRADGTSQETNIPTRWNPAANLAWKTALPGAGHASPIVWGDRVFTVTAVKETQERILLCLDLASGKILWRQTVLRAPLEPIHNENSYASSTPATDGARVYVAFLDRAEVVVAAYDFSGKLLWMVRPGTFASPWGLCSSPVLFEDKIIINACSKGEGSFLAALSRADGKTLWKVPQDRRTLSYSSPLAREMAGRTQLILAGNQSVTSLNPADGKPWWRIEGPSEEFVATPVFSEKSGLLYVSSSYPQLHLLAIRPDGQGDVTQTHIAWRSKKGVAFVPSPICVGEYFLPVTPDGTLFCYEAATGKVLWQEKLAPHHSSAVAVGMLVYLIDDKGTIRVINPGPRYELVAQSELGEKVYASPALSQGRVLVRGDQSLFCFKRPGK